MKNAPLLGHIELGQRAEWIGGLFIAAKSRQAEWSMDVGLRV